MLKYWHQQILLCVQKVLRACQTLNECVQTRLFVGSPSLICFIQHPLFEVDLHTGFSQKLHWKTVVSRTLVVYPCLQIKQGFGYCKRSGLWELMARVWGSSRERRAGWRHWSRLFAYSTRLFAKFILKILYVSNHFDLVWSFYRPGKYLWKWNPGLHKLDGDVDNGSLPHHPDQELQFENGWKCQWMSMDVKLQILLCDFGRGTSPWCFVFLGFPGMAVEHDEMICFFFKSMKLTAWRLIPSWVPENATRSPISSSVSFKSSRG